MSEISKYDYLKNDIYNKNNKNVRPFNSFYNDISLEDIIKTERRIGYQFPNQLKEFWEEIGYGFLRVSNKGECPGLDNLIMAPQQIANIVLLEDIEGLILPDIAEEIKPGYMPFFHIGDSSDFLFMKPNSENPNAVYEMDGSKVEDNFETFIYRLYHESPLYYNNYYITDKNNETK